MTYRKIIVCGFIKSNSPKAHEKRQHDCRPPVCKGKGCYGLLDGCESKHIHEITDRSQIKDMLAYLRKLKED
jgi:hypothetical protein